MLDFTFSWPEGAVRAVCWTLIHSLWIGVLVAGAAALVMLLTRRSAAWVRYMWLCGCLIAFAWGTGAVLAEEWRLREISGIKTNLSALSHLTLTEQYMPVLFSADQSAGNAAARWVNEYAIPIFGVWLLFFFFKTLKLTGGLLYVKRIRGSATEPNLDEWDDRLAMLAARMGITRPVKLLESRLVKVPVTIGHFKPLILIPVGMLLQLPPGQIDTILMHELAHIFRRDYLINLIQRLLEAAFFFNPGLLWLSGLIREEREACCDDMVLVHCQRKSTYLEALLAFQPVQEPNAFVLGLRGNALMSRFNRLVYQRNRRPDAWEVSLLLAGFLLFSAFSYMPRVKRETLLSVPKTVHANQVESRDAGSVTAKSPFAFPAGKINPKVSKPVRDAALHSGGTVSGIAPKSGTDTLGRIVSIRFIDNNHDLLNRHMVVRDEAGQVIEPVFRDNVLVSLLINGQAIPESDFEGYRQWVAAIDQAWAEARARKEQILSASGHGKEKRGFK